MRGELPLRLQKISPEELPTFHHLTPRKATDHIPLWRQSETKKEESKEQQNHSSVDIIQESTTEKENEEYIPTAEELELNPQIDLSKGIDCKTLNKVSPKEL